MATIGLGMMVKNEQEIIRRALDSAKPLVDYVLVVDTGSIDNTQAIVANWLEDNHMPSWMLEEPWRDFGYNRSFVLAKMREIEMVDYCLMLDADEVVRISGDLEALRDQLTDDCYSVTLHRGSLVYSLPRLTRNDKPFFYRGPAHEWLDCEGTFTTTPLDGVTLRALGQGARTRDPDRYRREAELFAMLLEHEDKLSPLERTRYTFYLAQSWRDCDEPRLALAAYWKRAVMAGWPEEVYISLLNAARLHEKLNDPITQTLSAYRRAIAVIPARAEAPHGAARACRYAGLHGEGYRFARQGIGLRHYRGLFVEQWIYDYGLLDEFSICAYYARAYAESWLAAELLLQRHDLDSARERLTANARFAQEKLRD